MTRVADIMSGKVIVANKGNKFSQVQRLFMEFNIHHLPIMNAHNELIGIISTHDLMRYMVRNRERFANDDEAAIDAKVKIEELMTKGPVTISPDDTVHKAAELFSNRKYQALPVVDDNKLVGIVTTLDIVNFVFKASSRP